MSNDKLKGADALKRFAQLFDGLPEAIALLEGSGSVEQAAAEAESALAARRRDIEIEDARLQARVDAANEAERRGAEAVEAASVQAADLIAAAETQAASMVSEAEAKAAAEVEAAAEKAKASAAKAKAADAKAEAAEARAVEFEARAETALQVITEMRTKLMGA